LCSGQQTDIDQKRQKAGGRGQKVYSYAHTEYLETEIAAKIKDDNNKVISSGQTQVYEEVFLLREPELRYLSQ
jgi:hypothetical protein